MSSIQLIRSATLKIRYNNKTILLDPMLGAKGDFESYGGIQKNPIVELPIDKNEVLQGVDMVLVSHLHKDHFDDTARELTPKNIPLFCQPGDGSNIEASGFTAVCEIQDSVKLNGIKISRTRGNHGRGPIEKLMGHVSGFVLQANSEPTVYIVGDCIFNEKVQEAIDVFQPDIVITNSGGAYIPGYQENLILLDAEETLALANYAHESKIIAVHLEALDHCTVSRAGLQRALLQSNANQENFFIPLDGEVIEIP